ncbi:HPGDS [Branchiostoma lanceolatum]|uniref:glutathione transferase n=1 Tax=Branchiostoma lanceolatum TaxID=7740 RepID=A0A8K0EFK6_BRALA|nr:HPGDS [Branchiostoma lanceolatum]
MAPKYKLTYFDVRSRGEPTRLIFAAAGVEYEDVRLSFEQWPPIKPTTPMGGLPMLEVDGKTLSQSMSIARFVAKETGLDGKNNLERALADAFVDEIHEPLAAKIPTLLAFTPDEKAKEELAKEVDQLIAEKLGKCERNSGSVGHLVGNSLLWCDLVFYNIASYIEAYKPGTLQNYPKLAKVYATVKANPRIAKWLERPAGQYGV